MHSSKLRFAIIILTLPPLLAFANNFEKEKNKVSENFQINSQQLGVNFPFVIGVNYSKKLGLAVDARYNYSRLFTRNTAFSLGLEAGSRNFRINTTLGHAFTNTDRVKMTLEKLRQKQEYTFRSGEVDEWLGQSGIGIKYEHLNPGKLFSDFHFGVNYARSDSKDLSSEKWLSENTTEYEVFNNERRIAGATQKSVVAGMGLNPRPSSKLNLNLH